jgi:limonene-1,2-epoxide hydrolase
LETIERLGLGMASVLTDGGDATIDAVFTPDYVEEYPQSGEIIRGREAIRRMLAHFPAGTRPTVIGAPRLTATTDGFVGEFLLDYGPTGRYRVVGIYTVTDGRVSHGREYFGAPFEPAAWRAPWVEIQRESPDDSRRAGPS